MIELKGNISAATKRNLSLTNKYQHGCYNIYNIKNDDEIYDLLKDINDNQLDMFTISAEHYIMYFMHKLYDYNYHVKCDNLIRYANGFTLGLLICKDGYDPFTDAE